MSKRFTETTIWEDDWFYELSPEYKLFWFYVKDNCSHAGIWQPKTRAFKASTDLQIDLSKALVYFNMNKERVRVLKNGRWFLIDFFCFQYGRCVNMGNRVHKSITKTLAENGVGLSELRGIVDIKNEENGILNPQEYDSVILNILTSN